MTNENPSSHATILVAVIGLIGVLGAAAIANWDSLFPEELVGMQHTEAQKSETLGSTSKQDPEVEREPQIPQKPEGDAELATSPESQPEAQQPQDTPPTPSPQCDDRWEWDPRLQICVKKATVRPKVFFIGPLEASIETIAGRIDFYTNTERLPGADSSGRAMYKNNKGALQVVIPIMRGNRMVGDIKDVIFSTNEGEICSVSGLPEATGWLKKMRVAYSLALENDCRKSGSFCQARLTSAGRVQVNIGEMTVTISKDCPN